MAKGKLNTSSISVIVSISLVLLMLGILGSIILKAKELSNYVKENIGLTIYLKDGTKNIDKKKLQKQLDASKHVKTTQYISKKEAAIFLQKDLGEDFIIFLGHNPLLASINVYLNAEYINTDSIAKIEAQIIKNKIVREVYYQKDLISVINQNIKSISFIILIFSGLLLIIATALINNSIRLSIYSKRFIIRSMQLVGATQSFIRRPFIIEGMIKGGIGSIIANIFILSMWYFLNNEFPEIFEIKDAELYIILFIIITFLGITISWLSTSLAVRKYLKIKTQKLY